MHVLLVWWRSVARDGPTLLAFVLVAVNAASTAAAGAIVYALLAAPLPVLDAHRLVSFVGLAYVEDALSWWGQAAGLEGLAAFDVADVPLRDEAGERWVRSVAVSESFFDVVKPHMSEGRPLRAEGEAVVSYRLWRERYQARNVIGTRINVGGQTYDVVGVAAPGFAFPYEAELWLLAAAGGLFSPLGHIEGAGATPLRLRGGMLGRLRDSSSVGEVRDQMYALLSRLGSERSSSGVKYGDLIGVRPITEWMTRDVPGSARTIVYGAVCGVLLSAASLTILLLVRARRGAREVRIKMWLGATSRRLAIEHGVTAGVTAVATAGAAVLLTQWFVTGVGTLIPGMPQSVLDRSAVVTGAPALAACIVFVVIGVSTLWTYAPVRRAQGPAALLPAYSFRFHSALIGVQTAAMVILVHGAVRIHSLVQAAASINHGISPGVIALSISHAMPEERGQSVAARREWLGLLSETLRNTTAGSVGLSSRLPVWAADRGMQELRFADLSIMASVVEADAGVFNVWGIRTIEGTTPDTLGDGDVVVARALKQRLFGEAPAVGRVIDLRGGPARVAAVVDDTRAIDDPEVAPLTVYVAFGCMGIEVPNTTYASVACTDCERAAAAANEALKGTRFSLGRVTFFERLFDAAVAEPRTRARIWTGYTLVGALVALMSVFGLVAYGVVARQKEIGIRIALGATPTRVVWLATGPTLMAAIGGIAAGYAAVTAWGLGPELPETSIAMQVAVVALVGGIVAVVALLSARLANVASPVELLKPADEA